jgi:hypothetical protein
MNGMTLQLLACASCFFLGLSYCLAACYRYSSPLIIFLALLTASLLTDLLAFKNVCLQILAT